MKIIVKVTKRMRASEQKKQQINSESFFSMSAH